MAHFNRPMPLSLVLPRRWEGGGYLPQVLVPTVKRTPKVVAVTAETEEQ